MVDIDSLIKNRFKLFVGLRSQKEDMEIYGKVYELCFDEILKFAEENLSLEELDELSNKVENLKEENGKEIVKASEIVVEAIKMVPDHQFKIYHRLEYFIDQLLIKSLQRKKQTISN